MLAALPAYRPISLSLLAMFCAWCCNIQLIHSHAESADVPTRPAEIQWQPYSGKALDSSPLAGELGSLWVLENRQRAEGKKIKLSFVRFRTSHPKPGPPIFFLAGGPGGSGIEGAAVVASHPQIRLLEHSDVIGIDQRGTGLSLPNLTQTVAEVQLPLDQPPTRADLIKAVQQVVPQTMAHWQRQGVDLESYNTQTSADDIDAIRRALGLDQIVLYAGSYGSHLGLAYLRYYSEAVARAVFSKVEGPNHTFKLPSTVQRHLELVAELVDEKLLDKKLQDKKLLLDNGSERHSGSDSASLLARVQRLLRQLEDHPIATSSSTDDGRPVRVTLSPLDLQIELSRALSTSNTIAEIPAQLERMERGDWSQLADAAIDLRKVSIHAMVLMMDCASGATADRWQAIAQEVSDEDNLLADGIQTPLYPEACEAAGWPDLGDSYRGPIQSNVPVLFTSGTLDVRTPPENVKELISGFVNAVHVVASHAGHENRELMSSEYRNLLQSFLRGETISGCHITLPQPIF